MSKRDHHRSKPKNSVEEWKAVLKGFESSGLNGAAYCRREGINYPTFAKWRKRILGSARLPHTVSTKPLFSRVERISSPASSYPESLQIRFPNGVLVSVQGSASPGWLLEVGGLK